MKSTLDELEKHGVDAWVWADGVACYDTNFFPLLRKLKKSLSLEKAGRHFTVVVKGKHVSLYIVREHRWSIMNDVVMDETGVKKPKNKKKFDEFFAKHGDRT